MTRQSEPLDVGLETLIKLRSRRRDVCRETLGLAERRERRLADQAGVIRRQELDRFDFERQLRHRGCLDVQRVRVERHAHHRDRELRRELERRQAILAELVEMAGDEFRRAEREVQVIEKLRDRRENRYRTRRTHREARHAQAVALSMFLDHSGSDAGFGGGGRDDPATASSP